MRTTSENYESRQQYFQLSSMPASFQDAIHVTLELGLEYLWIDALCIIQDDPSDWETESRQMACVYGNAHVVIGADDANNSDQEFMYETGVITDSRKVTQIAVLDGQGDVYAIESPSHWNSCSLSTDSAWTSIFLCWHIVESSSPLSTRAWAFQEQLLARRMIHLARNEIYWQCRAMLSCECSELDDDPVKVTSDAWLSPDKREMFQFWYRAVNIVIRRKLSRETDRLPCLSGLAALMYRNNAGDYLAGLWQDDLVLGLCWASAGPALSLAPK